MFGNDVVWVAGSGAQRMALEFDVPLRGAIRCAPDPGTRCRIPATSFSKMLYSNLLFVVVTYW